MAFKTCAEINLDNLAHNYRAICRQTAPALVIPVVKADAYGHGSVQVAKCLVKKGCRFFVVAQFQEAMELRDSGIHQPILIFGRLQAHQMAEAVEADLHITLFGKDDLRLIKSATPKRPVHVHIKIDTGMGRVGLIPIMEPGFIDQVINSPFLIWEGLYTHFSTSEELDKTYTEQQLRKFNILLSSLKGSLPRRIIIHAANSGAILNHPASYFDAVRSGIILYGHYPSSDVPPTIALRQVMTFKTYISHLRLMPADHPISYGRRWKTSEQTKIAVIPVGYADGIRRQLSNMGEVLIRGKRYPMVGAVTMDQTMIHVGNHPVQEGDEVVIWGDSEQGSIQVLEVAEKIGAIPYELTCGVTKRVQRVYTP
ncbi:alanine racemase [Desulfococcaceae bacterium HSG9]|nr:alanine racemase [Desulfococcaceae bacterium HSG9]